MAVNEIKLKDLEKTREALRAAESLSREVDDLVNHLLGFPNTGEGTKDIGGPSQMGVLPELASLADSVQGKIRSAFRQIDRLKSETEYPEKPMAEKPAFYEYAV